MQAFVPKNRKPKFELSLHIIDLTNIPLVVGAVYVKWHLPSSSAAEHRGRTERAAIREHRATWEYSKTIPVRLTIDRNLSLLPCDIQFEISQDYHDGSRGGRVHLGSVKLNLAEYTQVFEAPAPSEADGEADGRITRRYLMQDSKVNATIKIGISMKQIEGDTNYVAPPLRSAMVIGGIAGIMSAEAGEAEDMPSIASKSRELSEAQDIYRRTLAASWNCEQGELPPDKLIEDIFAGGDGGSTALKQHYQTPRRLQRSFRPSSRGRDDESTSSDADSKRTLTVNGNDFLTPDMARHPGNNSPRHRSRAREGHDHSHSQTSIASGVSGRGSIEQQMQHSMPTTGHFHHHSKKKGGEIRYVTEFDLRDDLRSWQVSA